MRARSGIWAAALLAFEVALHAAAAAVPPTAQTEIEYLLAQVGNSQCQFNRNGKWYDAAKAEAHLRDKYNYFAARSAVGSAEDFIEKAGSRSVMTGRSYTIRCVDGVEIDASRWLRERLSEYRAAQMQPLPPR